MAITPGSPVPLSASQGGAAIVLNDASVPGQVIHFNDDTDDPQHQDIIESLAAINPNPNTVSMWIAHQGPGVPVPASRDEMTRYDILASGNGRTPAILQRPLLVAPGYSLVVSTDAVTGNRPLLLEGVVSQAAVPADALSDKGYGGLEGRDLTSPTSIPSSPSWATMPVTTAHTTQSKQVILDPASNAAAFAATGVWEMVIEFTFTHNESNSSRSFITRLYNVTGGYPIGTGVPYGLARNQPISTASFSFLIQVEEADVNDLIRVEMQSEGAAIPVTLWDRTSVHVKLIDLLDP